MDDPVPFADLVADVRTAAAEERAADGEDVLLGVLGERRGGAAQAAQAFAIDVETIATHLTQARPVTEQVATERGLAPSAVSVLASSAAAARRLGASVVGTGHVLLAIVEPISVQEYKSSGKPWEYPSESGT